jgi:hypothetical protein
MPIGLPAAMKDSISLMEFSSPAIIPHRTVAARIEDGIEVPLLDAVEANGLVQLNFRNRVLLEPARSISSDRAAARSPASGR